MIPLIILIGIVFWNAYIDYRSIVKKIPINHTLEYLIFFLVSELLIILTTEISKLSWSFGHMLLTGFGLSTLAREAFFNMFLYSLRKQPLDYQSTQTTSVIDKAEHKLWDYIYVRFKVRIKDVFVSIAALLAYIIIIISFL